VTGADAARARRAGGTARLRALRPREASIFACLCDTVVTPEPVLPPVRQTDAVPAFDRMLAASPPLNRLGLRALLYAAELAPRALGFRARLRALAPEERGRALQAAESARAPQARELAKLLRGLACLSYYGDGDVMRRLGYDPDARVARGRELRAAEGRP
jgi:hypothetical protein